MEKNTQLPAEVTDRIFQEGQNMLAFVPDNKWSYIQGATAYAAKLHLAQQEIEKVDTKLNDAIDLIREVFRIYGTIILMHDSEFHKKIKKFSHGE